MRPEIDHFVPWARYPDNGLANLFVVHETCNRWKRDFLVAHDHLDKWLARIGDEGAGLSQLHDIAKTQNWEVRRDELVGVTSAIYLRMPDDAELWLARDRFELFERTRVERAFRHYG